MLSRGVKVHAAKQSLPKYLNTLRMKLIPIAAFPEKNIVAPAQIDFDTFVKVKKLPKLNLTLFKSKNVAQIEFDTFQK